MEGTWLALPEPARLLGVAKGTVLAGAHRGERGRASAFLSTSDDLQSRRLVQPAGLASRPSSNRTGGFPSYGFPTVFTRPLSQDRHVGSSQ